MRDSDQPIRLPPSISLKMELAELLPALRDIPAPTVRTLLKRYGAAKAAEGWIDMKFDPVDGKDRDDSEGFYRKDRIYGWIQGRGLESLIAHLRWAETMPDYPVLDKASMGAAADSLYGKLMASCFSGDSVKAYFVMDPRGQNLGKAYDAEETTLSHLFVLRGLLAYASHSGRESDLGKIIAGLRRAVDASIRGECLDDQIKFGDTGGEDFSAARKGYEGQMISIGACELLFAQTKAEEDLDRGIETIASVLSKYIKNDLPPGLLMLDALDAKGLPLRENGFITANPGHALEFVGLALQFFRRAAHIAGKPALAKRWSALSETLRALAFQCDRLGRAPHGGMVRSIDAESGAVLNGNCPWWSSFEAVRSFAELFLTAPDEAAKRYCVDRMRSYLRCIQEVYLKPSSIGIPVQTVSFAGEVIPVIPATPDIDAGYHTGMPLIAAYEILGDLSAMLCGTAEKTIPARLGVRLQGHIARTEAADRERDPLKVRCCWFASSRTQVLMLSADVLEFSAGWAEAFCRSASKNYGIPANNIFLMATHTHTAPAVIDLGTMRGDKIFLDSLAATMRDTIEAARKDMRSAAGLAGIGAAEGVGINRRYRDPSTGKVSMRPNFAGDKDEEILALFLFDAAGRPRAILANMALHPTTLNVSLHEISADYPGRAAARLRKLFGADVVVLPVQGACGDVRPMVLSGDGTEFAEGTWQDADRIGNKIADSVAAIFAEAAAQAKWIDGSQLSIASEVVQLPFARLPSYSGLIRLKKELESEIAQRKNAAEHSKGEGFAAGHENPLLTAQAYLAWAENLLESAFDARHDYIGPESLPARFSLCSLGPSFAFFSLPGEAFCRIGKNLKKMAAPSLMFICGYCGGSLGYIPTAEAFAEGGYEVEAAFRFYGFPAPLAPETETSIYSLFDSMRKNLSPSSKSP